MLRRPRLILFVASVTLAAIAFGAIFSLRGRKVRRFPYLARPLPEADFRALASKPGWQARTLRLADGNSLRGLLRPPAEPGGSFLLFFNGNSSTLLSESQELLNALLPGPKWGAAVWAYRGYDGSDGVPSPDALERDAWEVYRRLLKDEKLEPAAVHVIGFSLGTGVVASLVARASELPPASITLLAPMTELDMGERFQLRLHRYETLKYLYAFTYPTLVVHGGRDATLPLEYGQVVAEQLGARARLRIFPELGHLDLLHDGAVAEAVRAFILEHAR